MKRVVSVSLGSSQRDKAIEVDILGETFQISRIGTDGNIQRFVDLIAKLDGNVDAIGMGGVDRYLYTASGRYTIREAEKLALNARMTPIVDGSGVKNILERKLIEYLQHSDTISFEQKRVLVVCAVDRFGMAQAIAEHGKQVVYGDLMFGMGIPIPIRSYRTLCCVADAILPVITKLPFQWLYPTGKKQESASPKWEKYYRWADVIAGDFHIIKRYMPYCHKEALDNAAIITNTVTEQDREIMRSQRVRLLATATPRYDGRHFATNVFEGVLITLLGKKPEKVTTEDYEGLLKELKWKPTIQRFR